MILAIHSYPGANATVARHWPYFQNAGAGYIVGIGTTDGGCQWPEEVTSVNIGKNAYLDGPHLPQRLLDTLDHFEGSDNVIVICEYDCVFFKPLPLNELEGVGLYLTGGKAPGCKGHFFAHSPWAFHPDVVPKVITEGRKMLAAGEYEAGSPDTFLGLLCERTGIPVQFGLWGQYSRNSLDIPEQLEEARQACLDGVHVIHGVKTPEQLSYIIE